MKNNKAFSLIEVLIAIIILGIAMIAILQTTQNNIRSSIHVEKTLTANWVAMNILGELQIGLIPTPYSESSISGTQLMLKHKWEWQVTAPKYSKDDYFEQVNIKVILDGRTVQQLTGFVKRANKTIPV